MSSSSDQESASDIAGSSRVIVRQNSTMSLGILFLIILPYIFIAVLVMHTYSNTKDGEWSNWGEWNECHNGIRVRSRLCNNPAPSIFGQYCQGVAQDYELCNLDSCTVSNRNNLKKEIVEQFDKEKRTIATEHEKLKPNAQHPDEMDSMQETYTESSKYEELIDDAIKNDIIASVKALEKKTNKSESELEKVKSKVKSFETETQLIYKEVTAMSNRFNELKKEMSNDFNEHKKEIIEQVEEAIGDSIKRLSIMHSDTMVAFTVRGMNVRRNNVVFTDVLENIGNGYDSTTGEFTCTIPGIYIFSF